MLTLSAVTSLRAFQFTYMAVTRNFTTRILYYFLQIKKSYASDNTTEDRCPLILTYLKNVLANTTSKASS